MSRMGKGFYVDGGVIYICGTVNKKRYRFTSGKLATKANLAWVELNAQRLLHERATQPQQVTIEDFGRFSLAANAHTRKQSTAFEYERAFELYVLPHFGKRDVTDVKPIDLKAWQAKLLETGLAPSTVRNARAVLRGIMADAFMNELIPRNPFELVKAPRQNRHDVRPFTKEEVALVTKEAGGWFGRYLTVAFFTGLRTGELLGLRWEDVNWVSGYIYIRRSLRDGVIDTPKTEGSVREVEISPTVEAALRAQWQQTGLKKSGFVFCTEAGKAHFSSGNIIARHWKPLLKRLGLDYREMYQTRHTFASLMIAGGADVLTVARIMGHKTTRMTLERYARFVPGRQRAIAKFLDGEENLADLCQNGENG